MIINLTVCELRDEPDALQDDLDGLADHVKANGSDVVLLPEMGLSPWFAWRSEYDPALWRAAVNEHESAIERLGAFAPATVLGSRPVERVERRLNEAFAWSRANAYRAAHHKYYLPEQTGYWEAKWYERGDGTFSPIDVAGARIGFVICSELWFYQHSRAYGENGAHIIACPRATPESKYSKWLAGGRAAGVVSGAFSISSCKTNVDKRDVDLGGHAWIVDPEGVVLGETTHDAPFLTLQLDLAQAVQAKTTYPRYIQL